MALRVGFIGLGNIGRPMAERLVQAGLDPVVFDARDDVCREFAAAGVRVAPSCAEVAREAEVIGICVRDDADVRDVTMGAGGVIEAASAGTVLALHSTVLPSTVEAVAHAAAARGVGVVDAPVSGGAAGARQGKLTYMVGGDAELVERCRPVFQTSAAAIVHTGPLGSGAAMKLGHSIIMYLGFLAAYEAMGLAKRAGVSREALEAVTRASGVMSDPMLAFLRMRWAADDGTPQESLQELLRSVTGLAEKDLSAALTLAREHGLDLPGATLCRELMPRVYGVESD